MLLQLIFFATTGIAVWFGSRWVKQEVNRVDAQLERLNRALDMAKVSRIPTLQFNPRTGVYQPARVQRFGGRLLT